MLSGAVFCTASRTEERNCCHFNWCQNSLDKVGGVLVKIRSHCWPWLLVDLVAKPQGLGYETGENVWDGGCQQNFHSLTGSNHELISNYACFFLIWGEKIDICLCCYLDQTAYGHMSLKVHTNAAAGGQRLLINTRERLKLQRCKYAPSVTTSYITMWAPLTLHHVINLTKWANYDGKIYSLLTNE